MRPAVQTAVKAAVGIALLGLLLHRAEPAAVWRTMGDARAASLGVALAAFVAATVFEVLKLHAVIAPARPLRFTSRLVFIGLFYNTFLPANVGGDAYRIVALKGRDNTLGQAVLPVFLDRAMGVAVQFAAAALVIALWGTGWARTDGAGVVLKVPGGTAPWVALGACGAAAVVVGFLPGPRRWIATRIGGLWGELRTAWAKVRTPALGALACGSVGYHAGRVTGVYFFLDAFGAHVSWVNLVLVLTAVTVASAIPVSIGALGVREGALTAMLVLYGVPAAVALAVALLHLGVLWTKALVGGVWLLTPVGTGFGRAGGKGMT